MCVFCQIRKEDIINQNDFFIAFYDRFPVNKGHILIVPKRHVQTYFDLAQEEKYALLEMLDMMKTYADNAHQPDGYNIGINVLPAAGQTVMHMHLHLIPRYKGDMQDPRGGVRGVIPEKQKY